MPEYATLLFDVRDHVATMTLNRPERRNALNPQAYADIEAAFRHASGEDDATNHECLRVSACDG